MRIVCDMDEVLADFVGAVLKRWNAVQGLSLTRENVTGWNMPEVLGMKGEHEGLMDEWMGEKGFFRNLQPTPGAIEGFKTLLKNHDVVIATSIPSVAVHAFEDKRAWLREHIPEFDLHKFIACSSKGWINGDILIDDGGHNIKAWAESLHAHAIVPDCPWNRDLPLWLWRRTDVWRVSSWLQIVEAVGEIDRLSSFT